MAETEIGRKLLERESDVFGRKKSWKEFESEWRVAQVRLYDLIASWRAAHPETEIDVSEWESPYDYVYSFTMHSDKPNTADVVLVVEGTGTCIIVGDIWVRGNGDSVPYDEEMIVSVLDSVSSGDVRVQYYPFSRVVEIGHADTLIKGTDSNPLSREGWLALFHGHSLKSPLKTVEFAPWERSSRA